jgi:hypothetical protein
MNERRTEMTTADTRQQTEHKSFGNADEVREFPNGRAHWYGASNYAKASGQ